ncbi:MAG: hypothetical protein HKO98_12995, partial [Gemmatimonadetes bacterium]|nr:hypothetical protein [Gemmatimonadota bacterium]
VYSLLPAADRGDRIVTMVPVEDLEAEDRLLIFTSAAGQVKRTELSEFSNPRSTGLIAAGVKRDDRIIEVVLSDGTAEVMLFTRRGRAIRFAEADVPTQGRTARGVKGIGLDSGDQVVGVLTLRRDAGVLTVTDDGHGKRTPAAEFPLQKRGGMGTMFVPSSGNSNPVVAALEVTPDDSVMLITAGGRSLSAAVNAVPVQGRRTQGKRIVKIPSGDRVVEVTRTAGGTPESGVGSSGAGSAGGADDDTAAPAASGGAAGDAPPQLSAGAGTGGASESPPASPPDAGEGQLDLLG